MSYDFSYLESIEKAINDKFNISPNNVSENTDESNENTNNSSNDITYDMEDLQLFERITDYSYYPVKFSIDEDNKIRINKDNRYIGSVDDTKKINFYIGSKRQFLHKQYIIEINKNQLDLGKDFKTGWNESKFLVFLNGFLLNNNLLTFIIPNPNNKYEKKKIFSTVPFNKDDKVDVYYIESDDDYKNISVSKNTNLNQIKYLASINNQTIIKIPYPKNSYQDFNKNKFYVFNDNGKYLDNIIDYSLSSDNQYLVLSDINRLKIAGKNAIYFIFPNIKNQFQNTYNELFKNGNISTTKFIIQKAYKVDNKNNIYFQIYDENNNTNDENNYFKEYKINKNNCLIFNTLYNEYLNPFCYEIQDNNKIKLNNNVYSRFPTADYIMYIFNETDTSRSKDQLELAIQIVPVLKDNQKKFIIDPVNGEYLPFLVQYYNSILINENDLFSIDDTNHRLIVKNPYSKPTEILDGEFLKFIYLLPRRNKTIYTRFAQIQFSEFPSTESINLVTLPKEYNKLFSKLSEKENNFLFFINNDWVNIENYKIETDNEGTDDEIRQFVFTDDYKSKLQLQYNDNNSSGNSKKVTYTILYLKDYLNPNNISIYPDEETDMLNTQFTEIITHHEKYKDYKKRKGIYT